MGLTKGEDHHHRLGVLVDQALWRPQVHAALLVLIIECQYPVWPFVQDEDVTQGVAGVEEETPLG